MTLNIDSLVIEVTRKCNMQCEHCLRGPSQRKTIENRHLNKILRLIDNISTLSISGGEPTLAMDALETMRYEIIYGNCDVQNFYMATNGKAINVEKLAQWAYNMTNCCSDNEMSGIGFSFDGWHTNFLNPDQIRKRKRNCDNLQNMLEYDYGLIDGGCYGHFINRHSDQSWGNHNLVTQGRAKDFGWQDKKTEAFEIDEYDDTICITETQLYLSCLGQIVAGCSWSYNSIDYNRNIQIAHIDDLHCTDDLIEAIKEYNKKVEQDKEELQMA